MKYTITGDNLQFVNIELQPGEEFNSVAGAMAYMSGNMRMESKMEGGLMAGLKRSLSGASLFLLRYTPQGGVGTIGLAGRAPGKVLDVDVSQGAWIVQKTGYLGSETTVNLDMALQKRLGSMMFGGEGLILQRISGTGRAFIHACGDLNVVDLAPGQQYKVSTANAVAWEDTVSYDISSVGGLKTALFSGEGLFVTTLTGPGKIVIQSMTLGDLAEALIPYMPQQSS
ncbi:MAG TPA: TIGR00266 family protein [Euryarchaeota archaeon]|nr:TIGR00266 family protein [Euryarchaeota archaeon]